MANVLLTQENGVAVVTINRPDKLNALNAETIGEIDAAFREIEANPDTEILNALRPAMATVPGALLLSISSPYAKRGELWRAHEAHYGKGGDGT